jgi:diguanylate cyclase (GGDEF)-like protein/PAS domain S-box-containing protein
VREPSFQESRRAQLAGCDAVSSENPKFPWPDTPMVIHCGRRDHVAARLLKVNASVRGPIMDCNESLRVMASVFEHSVEGILVTDRNNRIVMVNGAFTRLTGYTAEDALGRDPAFLSTGRTPKEAYQEMWGSLAERGFWEGELWDRRKSGDLYLKRLSIATVQNHQGRLTHYVGIFSDITARRELEDRMTFLAHHDSLTQLPNRLNLLDRLEQTISLAKRNSNRVALMLIDLDRFKTINDTLGHHAGDRVLVEVAHRLRASLRESDIVARLAGDEFVVVITETESFDYTILVANKIIEVVSAPCQIDDREVATSPSVGISFYPDDANEVSELMANADVAMYRAKACGRGQFRFFDVSSNQGAEVQRRQPCIRGFPPVSGTGRTFTLASDRHQVPTIV